MQQDNDMTGPALALTLILLTLVTACSDDDSNKKRITPLMERYELGSPDSVPEGIVFDPRERAFYATSLQGGSITRVDADGTETLFRAADNRAGLVGTKIDADARRLWVCASDVDGIDDRIWVFDLDTAEMVLEFLLGALSTNGSCNDLVLDEDGIAYVTDPANPFLYRLDPSSGEGSVLVTDPLFADVTGLSLGLNGIAVAPDGSALIVAKFAPATLFRVSLPNADTISTITLSGDPLPAPDGLVELDGDIYTVSNGSVSRVRLNAAATAGEVITTPQISGLSTATVADDAVYVIKSEVTNFVLLLPLMTPFEIFSVDLEAFGP
jgi:sugar lactone lactonase YvrE